MERIRTMTADTHTNNNIDRRRRRDSAGPTRNFATEEPGETPYVFYRGIFQGRILIFISESAIITLIAFTKCSLFTGSTHIYHIAIGKMLDDGNFIFLANYVYTSSLYARTMIFFLLICSYRPFELCPGTAQSRRLWFSEH